jgi:hypothetical protein
MRYRYLLLIIVAALAGSGLARPRPAAATTMKVADNQIRVSGTVPDRRYLVVDANGSILQIFSNTAKPVAPAVVVGSIAGPAGAMTPRLRAAYESLIDQIRDNKVVSINKNVMTSDLSYPDFVTHSPPADYTVKPTRMLRDAKAEPYTISP